MADCLGFTTALQIEQIEDRSSDGRGTWSMLGILAAWFLVAGVCMRFAVPVGFITDLASVPRMPFVYYLAGGIGHRAAVLHDWLYTTHLVDRATADQVFYEALLWCGVPTWRAWLMYRAVRLFGGPSWDAPGPKQPATVQKLIDDLRP